MDTSSMWLVALHALAVAIPVSLGAGAVLSSRSAPFKSATVASSLSAVLAGLFAAGVVVVSQSPGVPLGNAEVRVDAITGAMLLLVCALGLIIVRYSRTYLNGDPGQLRYARWLLATLATVTTLVVANNLLVIAVAWTLTSLALHRLLTLFGDRPAALVAAHKKFLVSRLADLCLWSALALLYSRVGSLNLDAIASWAKEHAELPFVVQVAAVLCVVAVALKSAQLPFHGWLIQVMEAPTPVSALLHAGVVNLGGFLMIRLAPLMACAPVAQLLLVVVGMTTTVIATMVTTTRVSVKVSLAWSTCAQMGFMLVECGLGAWHLAFLHLLAHSLYKAHAFLGAGSAVDIWRLGALTRRPPAPSVLRLCASTALVLGAAAIAIALSFNLGALTHAADPSVWVLGLLVALSLVPMAAQSADSMATIGLRAIGVAALYAGWHWGAARVFAVTAREATSLVGWTVVAVGVGALFAAQSLVQLRPHGRWSQKLHTWLFAGLYLDEGFTRLTFRVWPPRLAAAASSRAAPRLSADIAFEERPS
ncbi:MAG: NADH-quinone oxidoreductase subunit L [Thermoanaerobaculia bacterium]